MRKKIRNLLYVWKELSIRQKHKLVFSLVLNMCVFFLSIISPFIYKELINKGIILGNIKSTIMFGLLLLFVNVAMDIIFASVEMILCSVMSAFEYKMNSKVFQKMLRVQQSYLDENNYDSILKSSAFNISSISNAMQTIFSFYLMMILKITGGFIGLMFMEYKLALVVIAVVPLNVLIKLKLNKKRAEIYEEQTNLVRSYAKWYGNRLKSLFEIRLYNYDSKLKREFKLEKKALVNQNIKSNFIKELSSVVNGLYTEIVRVILYIFGVLIIINNGLDTGSIIAFIAFALGVINPIGALMDISHQFDILSVSLEKLCTVYSQKNLRSGIKNIKKDKTICEFDHVTFSYNNKIILNDLSFKVKRGEKIALIGGNGTGKSTIAKLIMGLYDYKYGSIKLNKVEASTLSSRAIRNRIFYFPQSVNYLEGLGKKKEHSLSKIIGTIIQGSSLEKVNNQKVSGGQRKLLALNAEFDDSYDLYIFDELISEIDEKNSELILSKLINDPDKTIIFISHNDKVIERVDRVIQLDSKVLEGVCYESKNRSL